MRYGFWLPALGFDPFTKLVDWLESEANITTAALA
jgi:hypothetical protein